MSSDRYRLLAFLAVLLAIVILVIVGAVLAAFGKYTEALGIGGAVTGLIGVIGTFKPGQRQDPPANDALDLGPYVQPGAHR